MSQAVTLLGSSYVKAIGNENSVIWPSSADRFLSPSLLPFPLLVFISPSSRLWSGWHVAGGEGKDESSAQCKSLPLEKLASNARPHGPLTYRLCDLWRLGASGHRRLLSSLLQNCKEPHTLHHYLQEYPKRNSSHMLSCSTGTYMHTWASHNFASYTVSYKNKYLHKHFYTTVQCPAISSHVH